MGIALVLAEGFHATDVNPVITPLMDGGQAAIGEGMAPFQDGRSGSARTPGHVFELVRVSLLPVLSKPIRKGFLIVRKDVNREDAGLFHEGPRGGIFIETDENERGIDGE